MTISAEEVRRRSLQALRDLEEKERNADGAEFDGDGPAVPRLTEAELESLRRLQSAELVEDDED